MRQDELPQRIPDLLGCYYVTDKGEFMFLSAGNPVRWFKYNTSERYWYSEKNFGFGGDEPFHITADGMSYDEFIQYLKKIYGMPKTPKISKLTSEKEEGEKIQLNYLITTYVNEYAVELNTTAARPEEFDNIKLICKGEYYDIIAAWDDDHNPDDVCVYLGLWNSGTV